MTLYPGMSAMLENATLDTKNRRSHTVTAEIEVPHSGGEGVIIAQGGRFGGWTLYIKGGKLKYCYNWLDRDRYTVESKDRFPPAKRLSNSNSNTTAEALEKGVPSPST